MSRIAKTFARLQERGRKALIPFVTAGDPEPAATVPLMQALVEAGADLLELGVPFSDPMADGPVIQRATERALRHGVRLADVLDWVAEFRKSDDETPVVLMGYANPIEAMGQAVFAERAQAAGVDGVLTVDYPPEEGADFARMLSERGIDPIFLLAPTSREERIAAVARLARGFVYYVSLKGVTGATHLDLADVRRHVSLLRQRVSLPIAVGFGIRDAASARAVAELADAVVIGSRVVQTIEEAPFEAIPRAAALIREIREAVDSVAPVGA